MKRCTFSLIILLPLFLNAQCPREDLKALITTYKTVANHIYPSYWDNWQNVPKHLLLIEDEKEYLFGSAYTDSTFQDNCVDIPSRPATMNKNFLATFPYINYQPTIIIGTPENTNKTPLAWTITILHEHFHQLQFSHPNYYSAQKALDLDKGDQTGMWMLNHPFPYADSMVAQHIEDMANNLLKLEQNQSAEQILNEHLKLKAQLNAVIGEEHYRYLNLQLWQEGFARYMELSILNHWIDHFEEIPQSRFDRRSLEVYLDEYKANILQSLTTSPIHEIKRVYFYALGAAEALLIQQVNSDWKSMYFDQLFTTDHLLRVVK